MDYTGRLAGITQDDLTRVGNPHLPRSSGRTAAIYINVGGEVRVSVIDHYQGESKPMSIWEGRTRVYNIRPNADLSALHSVLLPEGNATILIENIIKGFEEYETVYGHRRGRLTSDAKQASQELELLTKNLPESAFTAEDGEEWLFRDKDHRQTLRELKLTLRSSDKKIEAAALELMRAASIDNIIFVGRNIAEVIHDAIEMIAREGM